MLMSWMLSWVIFHKFDLVATRSGGIFSDSYIPIGYVTFKNDGKFGTEPGQIRSRDVTSPIDPDDHSGCLDSSGDKGNKGKFSME